MGPSGLEPPTLRLSVVRSSQLSYRPIVGRNFALLASGFAKSSQHSILPPLQIKPASLGFDLAGRGQAAKAQKIYLAEAQTRYEQTTAFRHDIKNHLLILDSMLRKGQLEESRAYLQKLNAASTALFFPYRTGNPVVDILLSEKLGLAAADGTKTQVSVILPKSSEIEDVDWCVIFANALDNALKACRAAEGSPEICISGKRQGDFYLLEFQNTCVEHSAPKKGTGLSNIQSVAEKYHGAILTQKQNGMFSLSVLLNIS